jgi:hypothetical protein
MIEDHVGELVQDDVLLMKRAGGQLMEHVVNLSGRQPQSTRRVDAGRHGHQSDGATAIASQRVAERINSERPRDGKAAQLRFAFLPDLPRTHDGPTRLAVFASWIMPPSR